MNDKGMSDKERALLQAARREVAAKTKRQEVVDTDALARPAPQRTSPDPRPQRREASKRSRLDAQTVLGWDHPAAQKPASAGEDKWSRIAGLMEAERREAQEKRAKARRAAMVFLFCLLLVVLVVGGRSLLR